METKHTKGEWLISGVPNNPHSPYVKYGSVSIKAGGGYTVAEVMGNCGYSDEDNYPNEESKANAKLIAAAPELLTSLSEAATELNFIIDNGLLKESKADVPYFKAQVIKYLSAIKKATL